MNRQAKRLAARGFAESNLSQLAADILTWRKRAALPVDSKVHELAKLCAAFSDEGDEYQAAERLVIQFALNQAAGTQAIATITVPQAASAASLEAMSREAYERLLPKLRELMGKFEELNDDEYGEWLNALPFDEFKEYIGAASDKDSFLAAMAEAERLYGPKSSTVN